MQLENDSKQIEILLKKNILFYVFGVILFFAIIFLLNYIYFTKIDTKAFDEAKIFQSKMVETINNSKDKNVDDLEDDLIEVVKEWNSLYVVGIDVTRTHKSSFYIQKSNYKYVQFPNKTLLKIDLNKMINNQAHAFLIKTTLSFDNLILATYSIPHICKNIYFEKFIPFILSMIMVLSLMFLLKNQKIIINKENSLFKNLQKYKKVLIVFYFLLLAFSIYKVVDIEYSNKKNEIEKVKKEQFFADYKANSLDEGLAIQYFKDKDYSKALEVFTDLSNKNMTISIYYLGLMYEKGYGVDVDIKKASILYKRSALQGFILPLIRLRNLILKDNDILNDGTKLSKALRNVALNFDPEKNDMFNIEQDKNVKILTELVKFYNSKNIVTITNDYFYEVGKKNFMDLYFYPEKFNKAIKEVEAFDNQENIENKL